MADDSTEPNITPLIFGTLGNDDGKTSTDGWFVSRLVVNWKVEDPESPILSAPGCEPRVFDTDTSGVTLTCSATSEGGSKSVTKTFTVDKTPPQVTSAVPDRGADVPGWYNHPLTITFGGSDATSQIDSCSQVPYSQPDNATASITGFCRDKAGNQSGSLSFPFKYDGTPPTLAPAFRAPDANGWYNHALEVSFPGTDATSGIQACTANQIYDTPDSATAAVTGTCRDVAGNTTTRTPTFRYDDTAPTLAATPSRAPDANTWYRAPLTVSFPGADATSGIAFCSGDQLYAGPETPSVAISGFCRDTAGNTTTRSLAVRYDGTAPQVTNAVANRNPDSNGWYNHALAITFGGADATSGIDTCTQSNYSQPDTATAFITGTCRDKAGNQSGSLGFPFKYDATPPAVTASASRGADANGWYNRPLSVSFSGGDVTSGLESCDGPLSYSGPDISSVSVGGGCRDKAGNLGSASVTVKYDANGPQTTATASRQPNANGWYNTPLTVGFSAVDSASGLASCPAQQTYTGPDASSAVVSGTCVDNAGNTGSASLTVKYDATVPQVAASPSRAPNGNGWFNTPVEVAFQGSDSTSGIDSCSAPQRYSGPDNGAAAVSGSCRDRAGNPSATAVFALKYDSTAPVVTDGVAVRSPDHAGWYTQPVAFALQGTDATSGIDACPPENYAGPDSADASFSGSCFDKAGNRGTKSFPLKYDDTGPAVTADATRGPDINGWYNHPLTVSFVGSDTASGLESCAGAQGYEGPDSVFAVVTGTCVDKAGNVGLGSLAVKYDSNAPQVSGASPDRAPDGNGWYNHPLTVSFLGSDATSQVDACTTAGYAGPDNPAASIAGSCRDRAGNQSGASAFAFRYDGTAPSVTNLRIKAGNRSATLSWDASPDTSVVEIVRRSGKRGAGQTVYRGTRKTFTDPKLENGVRYRYTVTGYDEARNATTREVAATPTAPLLSPQAGATVSAPPRLVWKAAEKATYYNVQVWRRGRVFSAWPTGTSIQLRRSWTYNGRRYRLTPGRYRWYVWPGYGRRAEKNFGRLLGSSAFVVR